MGKTKRKTSNDMFKVKGEIEPNGSRAVFMSEKLHRVLNADLRHASFLTSFVGSAVKTKGNKWKFHSVLVEIKGKHALGDLKGKIEKSLRNKYGTPKRRAWMALEELAFVSSPEGLPVRELTFAQIEKRKKIVRKLWMKHEKTIGRKVKKKEIWKRV